MKLPAIRVYNTISRDKQELTSLVSGKVGLYVCGPTVYSYVHIGNARTFTTFDVVVRYLRARGLNVLYVRNYTDVDDKIIEAALANNESAESLAQRFSEAFDADAQALGLLTPDVAPKVSQHIPEIVAFIAKLIEKGHAYESAGDVYFAVSSFESYGRLSGKQVDKLETGHRDLRSTVAAERKRDAHDFALWKAAKAGEPSWPSPWSPGVGSISFFRTTKMSARSQKPRVEEPCAAAGCTAIF
jgi:cysteinyl-tRNA synthetase